MNKDNTSNNNFFQDKSAKFPAAGVPTSSSKNFLGSSGFQVPTSSNYFKNWDSFTHCYVWLLHSLFDVIYNTELPVVC